MKRASTRSYDLFKTIVTVILAVILLLMLLRGCATNGVPLAPAETTTSPNATEQLPSSPVQTQTNPASEVTETLVPSLVPSTVEPTTSPTTVVPSATPTSAATEQATTDAPTPTPTSAAPDAATPTPAENVTCNTSMPSRLAVGQTARVVQRLNMRNDASIDATLIQTNPTNTQVEIIGGPVCTPVGDRAYLWWQIRLPDGAEGWSAETPLNDATYFLEPIP